VQTPSVVVVMPVYNEAGTAREAIERVLRVEVPGVELRLLIIESSSTDGTRAIVEGFEGDPRVSIVYQEVARGKGHAVREAFAHVGDEIILIQDADLEYDTADYGKLLAPILSGDSTFVLGSRHVPGEPIRKMAGEPLSSFVTNIGHAFFCWVFNVVYRVSLSDPFTMYKVFPASAVHGMRFSCNRFDFDWELAAKLIRTGHRPLEIPVAYTSRGFKQGKKVRMFRDPLTWLWAALRFRVVPVGSFTGGEREPGA
jgi:glycosyltransferase involved in cell wall biosynthesis